MAAPSVITPSSTASANAALVGRFGRMVTMLAVGYPSAGDSQSLLTGELPGGCKLLPSQPDQATIAAQRQPLVGRPWLHADHHVRHEAPPRPGGDERTPPLACRSRPVKLRAA